MTDTTKPANEKAHGCDPVSFQNDTTKVSIIPLDKAARKHEKTLIAQFSIAGHLVHKGECGDYLVLRWGMSRFCKDLEALEAFAKQVGVAS